MSETPQVKWSGELDANGCFKAGVAYTVTVTERMGDARWSKGTYNFKTAGAVINLHKVKDAVLSENGRTVTGSYTFPALKTAAQIAEEAAQKEEQQQAAQDAKDEKDHAADLARRWSLAEASTVANYPLGSPITLLVNEETLKGTDIEDYKPFLTNDAIIRSLYGRNDKFYTLGGETIENKGLPTIDMNTTVNHYRVTRVVYDYYRADDPSLDRFPNCTELWLSPKCDIDGILKTLGNITLDTQFLGDFFEWNCTVFIPDSLYPNGPTYNGHPAPGCKVMLYSGSDVYAAARAGKSAARAGKSAARDWCTNHSYTYQYISEDRRYTYPTCQTDAKFYYSCSKCGKCERNPNHTFYPTVGTFDNGEDGGLHTAHSFKTKVVTDEHYLGLNADGDRVYLYACDVCGKDNRQSSSTPKQWDKNTGGLYKWALTATVGKDHPNGTCTIEQAIAVASRSLYADRTGWYQKNSSGSDWLVYGTRVWVYYKNGQACYRDPYGFELTGVTFDKGLRPIKDR